MDETTCFEKNASVARHSEEILLNLISKANLESQAVLQLDLQLHPNPTSSDRAKEMQSVLPKLTPVLEEEESKEIKQGCAFETMDKEQKHIGILHMWWGLIQDQLGTFVREIDSLRAAHVKMQVRLTEDLMQRSESQAELKRENAELLLQLAQENVSLKDAMEKTKDENACAIRKLSEALGVEARNNLEMRELIDQLRLHVKASLDERSLHIESSLQNQAEQLQQLMSALNNDLRAEVDQRISTNDKAARDIASLQFAHNRELLERESKFQELQSKVSSLSDELAALREDGAHRQSKLQAIIVKHFGEQQEYVQKILSDEIGAERISREEVMQKMLTQFDADREARRKELDANRCQVLSVENLKSEVDMVRTALAQMVSNGTAREEWMRREIDAKVESSLASFTEDIKTLEGASADRLSSQLQLQDQISMERQLREQTFADQAMEVKQEILACFEALKDIITEERALREDALTSLENDLKSGPSGCTLNEVKRLMGDMCAKEREQVKTLLGHAKNMLDSDEALRAKLEAVLQSEMVTKAEFFSEINRLWQTVQCETCPSIGFSKDSSSCSATLDRDCVTRTCAVSPTRGARGSSSPPKRSSVAIMASLHSTPAGSYTPRKIQLAQGSGCTPLPPSRVSKQSPR